MEITTEFLRDEVRSGFYIPTAIKQAWAAQLHILKEIDRICKKYNITYFADWGTFLGTVRHGGYIPWDDDLDISMKREDYTRFMQVADEELPEGFAIHNFERKEGHWLFLTRVVNKNRICYDKEHLDRYYNFPFIATVDIFVLDYLYKDEKMEKKRCDEVKYLIALADAIVGGKLNPIAKAMELSKVENLYHTRIDDSREPRDIGIALYNVAQQQMARVTEKESDRIGQIFPWVLKGSKGLPKEYYEKAVRLPFEEITMPVPVCYHKVLRDRYGDYFKIYKVWNGHDYPYFEGQRKNLRAEADFELPEFTFDKNMLRTPETEIDKSSSLKCISKECLDELKNMVDMTGNAIAGKMYEEVISILPECQQLAIDLGTLVENVKGEENPCTKAVVAGLEMFCETLYEVYEVFTDEAGVDVGKLEEKLLSLRRAFTHISEAVKAQIIDKKVVLFVSTGPKLWSGFESLYQAAKEDPLSDVYVVPVPAMQKDVFGQVKMTNEEIMSAVEWNGYPHGLKLVPWNSFSLELHHPEVIFIQDSYDGENECLTIPDKFYAKNLQKYTDKLVYIPPFEVEEFSKNDTTALYNMKHYVTKPGVVIADKVIVQSDNTKNLWVDSLTEFAGEDTKKLWQEKILSSGLPVMDLRYSVRDNDDVRKLLFGIGLNWATESGNEFLESLRDKLFIVEKYCDNLHVGLCMYPGDAKQWETAIGKERFKEADKLLRDFAIKSGCELFAYKQDSLQAIAESYDAYYGSPTPLAHSFNHKEKPVMLMFD